MSKAVLPNTPYKGLVPYSEEDAPFFFGRDSEREIITANLMASRLTLLYGPSGAGKSSVLRAGVAHQLRQLSAQNLTKRGAAEFAVVVFSAWRDNPHGGLIAQVQDSISQTLGKPSENGSTHGSFTEILKMSTERVGGRLLIILDQFEEYFLYHGQEDGAGTFAVEFPKAINNLHLPVSFLISIREDALAKLDRFEGRIPNLFDNYLRVEHLDRDSAREAIIKPIDQYNRLADGTGDVSIEPALVEEVLKQVRTGQVILGEAGRGVVEGKDTEAQIETPYLQLVMTRLWNEEIREGSRVLRLETLNNLGGAERIVKTHLDEAMSGLGVEEQDVAARIFRFLVTSSGTKIALSEGDLAELGELRQEQLVPVIEELSSGEIRILRPIAPMSDNPSPPRYEIFHDVLVPAILDWRARYAQSQERAKAEKKLALEAEVRTRTEKQLEREQNLVRRQRWILVAMGILLLMMIGTIVFAFHQQAVAWSRELAASAMSQMKIDPDISLVLATEAVRVKHTAQAEEALRQSLLEPPVYTVIRGHTDSVRSAAFSPDGKLIVTGSFDHTARVWDASTGESLRELRGHTNKVNSAAFSPDGKFVVTASDDNTARVWDASTGESLRELRGHGDMVNSAAFSPDGKLIVTASYDNTARVWDASTGQSLIVLRGHMDGVRSAAFSPDGKFVVTASYDNTARVWDMSTGERLSELRGHMSYVNSAAFSPDGKFVVTASDDNTARVWDASTGQSLIVLRGHTNRVNSAAFSPDGKLIVTASYDNTARVWDVSTGERLSELRGHKDGVRSAAFSPDGKLIVTASDDTTAQVWDVSTGERLSELRGHTSYVNSAAFSPNGKLIVTASDDGAARVWDVSTGQSLRELRGHTLSTNSAAFSPDGSLIVTTSTDGTARVWDASTGQSLRELRGHTNGVLGAEFSPNGKLIVTASADRTARVWDVSTGQSLSELRGHTSYVNSAAFSPDGKLIVTASNDGTSRIYPFESFAPLDVLQTIARTRPRRELTEVEKKKYGLGQ
jgi:WD40 repeat protein